MFGLLFDPERGSLYHRAILVAVCLITAVAAFGTASRFSRGDRLLACWILIGAAYALSGLRHGIRLLGLTVVPTLVLPNAIANAMVIGQNVFIALALLLFVLAWRRTGLAAPGSRAAQLGSIAAGVLIAIVVGGYPLTKGMASIASNPVLIISTLGDMIGIALIVPLAMPALAMRGGLLMHTWVYLAASEAAWLLYDIWWALELAPVNARTGSAILEAIRLVAIGFAFAAAVAQRRALR
ncbi:MAG: hypothetical protein ACLGH0_02125 [Thermoanaerobaculia bacterium]